MLPDSSAVARRPSCATVARKQTNTGSKAPAWQRPAARWRPTRRQRRNTALARIESERRVRVLLAIESGSRAWGFPSADSDYDVRFVYVGTLVDYLSIANRRDVIEQPIVGNLDVNGWDLRKAL